MTQMRVDAITASVKIIVPPAANVTVRSPLYLSETHALGAGLIAIAVGSDLPVDECLPPPD